MIEHKYGTFSEEQFDEYKKQLHKKLFWLLIYKDPETKDQFPDVDQSNYEQYFYHVMHEIDGLNSIFHYPVEICNISTILESALHETQKEDFQYRPYRKLILDAHALIDKIQIKGKEPNNGS